MAAIDPDKLVATLKLINTFDLKDFTLKTIESLGGTGAETLAADIIARRDTQPARKFETWEALISAKVTKLTPAMALKIIEKLK